MTLSLKQRAEEICSDLYYNIDLIPSGEGLTHEDNVSTILKALEEVREETIRECAEIANNWMDSVGELPQSETFMTAEGIRNHILLRLLPPPKTECKPDCVSRVATLNRFKCNCQTGKP